MRDLSRLLDGVGRRMDRIFEDMEAVFDEAMEGTFPPIAPSVAYQVTKTKNGVTILVGVPGCAIQDVQVTLAEGIITVMAENPWPALHPIRAMGPCARSTGSVWAARSSSMTSTPRLPTGC